MSKRNLDSGMRHGCVHAADLSQACTCATLRLPYAYPVGCTLCGVTPDDLSKKAWLQKGQMA